MNAYETGPFAHHPLAATVARFVLAVTIACLFAAAWLTAGPGNGYQPPRELTRVTLPTVVIVGQREAPRQALVASAAAVNPVNLRQ